MLHLQYLEMDRLRPDNQIVAFLVFPIGWSWSWESKQSQISYLRRQMGKQTADARQH